MPLTEDTLHAEDTLAELAEDEAETEDEAFEGNDEDDGDDMDEDEAEGEEAEGDEMDEDDADDEEQA